MRSDRYTKVVLTVIAFGLWALTMAPVGTPLAGATESTRSFGDSPVANDSQQGAVPLMDQAESAPEASVGPTSTLPLRWRVSWSALNTGSFDTWCSTAIVVMNTKNSKVQVEVEWMDWRGIPVALRADGIAKYRSKVWTVALPGGRINNLPWGFYDLAALPSDFQGYALVTANDPRILVSAFQYCRTDVGFAGATIVAHTNIPAYPVGTTMDFFQAGMPAAWTPPMAAPEGPETPR